MPLHRCRERPNTKYQIGTSGFMVSQSVWFDTNCLNCIEINSTFYHLPSEKSIQKWKHQFPPNVGIVIKASKYITHIKRLKDVEEAWNTLWRAIRAMRKYIPARLKIAFEFRDISWFVPSVYKSFRSMNWCVAGTYIIKKEGSHWMGTMPPGLNLPPRTANFTYLRIHGGRGYRGSLSEPELSLLLKSVQKEGGSQSFIFFNNTFGKKCVIDIGERIRYAAVCNAIEFSHLIQRRR
jgi:uncharacterized protein YecE (DUF72 family)